MGLSRNHLLVTVVTLLLCVAVGCAKKEPKKETGKEEYHRQKRQKGHQRAEFMTLVRAGKCAEARPKIDAYIKENPKEAEPYNVRGFCHEKVGETREALEWYRRAQKREPANGLYASNIAKTCYRVDDFACSMRQAQKLRDLSPRDYKFVLSLVTSPHLPLVAFTGTDKKAQLVRKAQLKFRVWRWNEAEPLLKDALAEDPDNAPMLMSYALLYAYRGKREEAEGYLQRAWSKQLSKPTADKGQRFAYYLFSAILSHRNKLYGAAITGYRQALLIIPNHPAAMFGLGAALHLNKNRNEALDLYKKLKVLAPNRSKRLFSIIMSK